MEQMRSEFENWWNGKEKELKSMGLNFIAISRRRELYKEAWSASRNTFEIELPPVCDAHSDDTDKGYDICHYRIQGYLKKQGLKFRIEGADRWKEGE